MVAGHNGGEGIFIVCGVGVDCVVDEFLEHVCSLLFDRGLQQASHIVESCHGAESDWGGGRIKACTCVILRTLSDNEASLG